jgi:cytosine/uracil/thiamine/allantoin permease
MEIFHCINQNKAISGPVVSLICHILLIYLVNYAEK